MLEAYFDMPYWVVDILPEQVPEGSRGQYFALEEYYLQPGRMDALHRRFADILLKLNCYCDFRVFKPDGSDFGCNPEPKRLAAILCDEQADLCIHLPDEDALITVNHDDTYMTVYHPSDSMRRRLAQLALAEGLFFWQPRGAVECGKS